MKRLGKLNGKVIVDLKYNNELKKNEIDVQSLGSGNTGSSLDDNIVYISAADAQNNVYCFDDDDATPAQFAKGSSIVILYNVNTKKVGYYRATLFQEEFTSANTKYDYVLGGIMDVSSYKYLIAVYSCMLKGSDGRELKDVMSASTNDFEECADAWYNFVCTDEDYKQYASQTKMLIQAKPLSEILDVSDKTFVPYDR